MTAPGRPTLADVARRAGVSLKTASRAVNGEYGVAPETADRVLNAARELGFRPNRMARSLASGRATAAVGLVIAGVADPFFSLVAGSVEDVLATRDLQLITASHGDDPERQRRLVQALVERRVDGLLLVPAPGDASYVARELDHGLVVVALDRPLEGAAVDTVTVDNRSGAAQAVRQLIAAGHRRIALLSGDGRLWTCQERLQGYRTALAEAGLGGDPGLIAPSAVDAAGAQEAIERMLRLPDPPTAFLATSPLPGRGGFRAMRVTGVQLEAATFDDVSDPDLLSPPPLVVQSSPERLGTLAAQMMLERLDGLTAPARGVVLPTTLADFRMTAGIPLPGVTA
jgi:LacI family transcriptional regulator